LRYRRAIYVAVVQPRLVSRERANAGFEGVGVFGAVVRVASIAAERRQMVAQGLWDRRHRAGSSGTAVNAANRKQRHEVAERCLAQGFIEALGYHLMLLRSA
jgi:hypothetical protein